MIANASRLAPDAILLDLEDAVAAEKKQNAREVVIEALTSLPFETTTVTVRINAVTTSLAHRDLLEVVSGAGVHVDCIAIPKVEDVSHVHFVHHLLEELEADLGLERRIGLEVLIEDARGAMGIQDIVNGSDRIEAVMFGLGDYSAAMGVFNHTASAPDDFGHQWHWVMSTISTVARARGIQAIDGPYLPYRDPEGFVRTARRARMFGFVGKLCIHPDQLALSKTAFSVTPEEYKHAERLSNALGDAAREGVGAISFEGRLADEASWRRAEDVRRQWADERALEAQKASEKPGDKTAGLDAV